MGWFGKQDLIGDFIRDRAKFDPTTKRGAEVLYSMLQNREVFVSKFDSLLRTNKNAFSSQNREEDLKTVIEYLTDELKQFKQIRYLKSVLNERIRLVCDYLIEYARLLHEIGAILLDEHRGLDEALQVLDRVKSKILPELEEEINKATNPGLAEAT